MRIISVDVSAQICLVSSSVDIYLIFLSVFFGNNCKDGEIRYQFILTKSQVWKFSLYQNIPKWLFKLLLKWHSPNLTFSWTSFKNSCSCHHQLTQERSNMWMLMWKGTVVYISVVMSIWKTKIHNVPPCELWQGASKTSLASWKIHLLLNTSVAFPKTHKKI